MKEEFEIKTNLTQQEIEKRVLKLIDTPFSLLFFIKLKQYSGSFKENSFKIQDTASPPVELKGLFLQDEKIVKISVTWESMKKTIKGFIYALNYPLVAVAIFLLIYYKPSSFFSYFLSSILLIFPVVIYKCYSFFYIVEPNPEKLINDIKKALK